MVTKISYTVQAVKIIDNIPYLEYNERKTYATGETGEIGEIGELHETNSILFAKLVPLDSKQQGNNNYYQYAVLYPSSAPHSILIGLAQLNNKQKIERLSNPLVTNIPPNLTKQVQKYIDDNYSVT